MRRFSGWELEEVNNFYSDLVNHNLIENVEVCYETRENVKIFVRSCYDWVNSEAILIFLGPKWIRSSLLLVGG